MTQAQLHTACRAVFPSRKMKSVFKAAVLTYLGVAAFATRSNAEPVTKRELGLCKIVGRLDGWNEYGWFIVVSEAEGGQWAEMVDVRREGKISILQKRYVGLTVEVMGSYTQFISHVRGRDLSLGQVMNIAEWRVVPRDSKRGVWKK